MDVDFWKTVFVIMIGVGVGGLMVLLAQLIIYVYDRRRIDIMMRHRRK